jgi:hypothetical protein
MSVKPLLRDTIIVLAAVGLVVAACDESNGPTPVPVPTGLAASQLSLTSVRVTWNAATGVNSYVLQRADANNPGTFVGVGGTLTATTYDNTGLTTGLAYIYRVAAVRGSDTSAFSSTVSFTTGLSAATINANITVSRTLYADTVYKLSGYIKVASGAVLTIQPGTRIIGDTTVVGSSLWILRGARIEANGTALAPIVFTSARSAGNRKPGDWGGIIIVGAGIINRTGATISTEGGAAGVAENYAGGANNSDNSGTLRYVRIEFAGFDISAGGGQELNSLSMYAVGRGTTLEYVQTMAGLDDAFEWWGGAVDGRYLVSYETGDDHFDATEGYLGRNQFLIAYQTTRLTPQTGSGILGTDPRGFEIDGCDAAAPPAGSCTMTTTGTSTPYTNPTFANFTIIGPTVGHATFPTGSNAGAAVLRRGTAGYWANGILARWKGVAVNVRDAWTDTLLSQRDSLNVVAVLLAENEANYDTTSNFGQAAKFASDGHKVFATTTTVDTLVGLALTAPSLDWTPKTGSPANTGGATVPAARVAGYFGGTWANTAYLGAADPAGTKWWQGWTAYNIN